MDEKANQISEQLDLLDELAEQVIELQEAYRKDYEAEDAFAIGAVQGIQKAYAVIEHRANHLRTELLKTVVGN